MTPSLFSKLLSVLLLIACAGLIKAQSPLRPHSENPYILEFRGEPTVLRTFAEHYSSVINEDFEYIPYLDSLKASGINLTRIFLAGFRVDEGAPTLDPLGPPPSKFLQPWPREEGGMASLDGLGKWDLSRWNDAYFERLNAFLRACSERDIVVEITFFCTFYTELQWRASPFHPENNVQGIGPGNRYDSMRPVDANLYQIQQDFVRKVVEELNAFDHIYYEIQNEPFWNEPEVRDSEEVEFHRQMLSVIRSTESSLPHRHLVAHNFPQQISALPTDFDVINAHYPKPVPNTPVLGAEALLRDHYDKGRILALDETDTQNATQLRLEAWMFLLGGGSIYNGLDYVNLIYNTQDEAGGNPLGVAKRKVIRDVGNYVENLDLISLRRNLAWWESEVAEGATLQAMASPGQQYVAYIHHGGSGGDFGLSYDPIDSSPKQISPAVTLEPGTWRAVWTRPEDLSILAMEEFEHGGGSRILGSVSYQEDVALRIDRIGEGDATPPPLPRGLIANAQANGSIDLSWKPSIAADFSAYRIYRGTSPDFVTSEDARVAIISAGTLSFNDSAAELGETYFYKVTAIDERGNESASGRVVSAVSQLRNVAFGGVVRPIPGTIMAEDFDEGGQDIAFNDMTPGNEGAHYRLEESVDIEPTSDDSGSHHITATETGEWLKYSVLVDRAGPYLFELRVANPDPGGQVILEVDGVDVSGVIDIPATGAADAWQTVRLEGVHLDAGSRVLRLVMAGHAPDAVVGLFNWMRFTHENPAGPVADAGPDLERTDEDGDGSETIILDASRSRPGDSAIATYEWFKDGELLADGSTAAVSLPVGNHEIELKVSDLNGLISTDTFQAKVVLLGLVNGSFEQGLVAWSASGNLGLQSNLPYAPTQGAQLMSFNGGNAVPNGVLSQTVRTLPGQTYVLSFDMGVLAYNTQVQRMQLEVSGEAQIFSQIYSLAGLGAGRNRWTEISVPFLATGSLTTLAFRDRSSVTGNLDLLLDNIRLVPRITRSLSVATDPPLAVEIQISPADDAGRPGGFAPLERSFPNMTAVTLSAPASTAGYRFLRWASGDASISTETTATLVMDSNKSLIAVYEEGPPTITRQPVGGNFRLGDRVVLEVEAVGPGTLAYQWRRDGEPLPGADGDVFSIEEISEDDFGRYDVLVSSAGGEVTSAGAPIGLLTATLVNGSFENDLEGWTPTGNLTVQTSLPYRITDGAKLVAFNSGNQVPGGQISQTFATTPGQVYVVSMDTGVLAYNTLEQRMEVNVAGSSVLAVQNYVMRGQGGGNNTWFSRSFTFTADSASATLTIRDRSTQTNIIDLLLDNVKVTPLIMRSLLVQSAPLSGVEITASPADSLGRSGGTTEFGRTYIQDTTVSLTAPAAANGYGFQSWTLDGEFFSNSRSISIVMDGDKTLGVVYAPGPPVITRQPASATIPAGTNANFSVEAVAVGAMRYQWRFNQTEIPGANGSSLSIPSVNPSHVGNYDVVISGDSGSVTSAVANLQLAVVSVASLVNGSFESGISGWTGSGNQYVQMVAANPNIDGVRILVFNGANSTPNGVVTQSFATVPGQSYEILFRMGVLAFNRLEQRLQVDLNGSSLIRSQTFALAGLGGGLTRWQETSLVFTANSSSTTLTFRDRSATTNAIDLYLDHARVRPLASALSMAPPPQLAAAVSFPSAPAPVDPPGIQVMDDEVLISIHAKQAGWYHLEESADLKKWEPVESRWAELEGPLTFSQERPAEDRMFYRIAIPVDELNPE